MGSSIGNLPAVLSGISNEQSVVAYLDAHWNDYLPTTSELNFLIEWGGPFIAIIDDFQVPNFPGYGFDQYGEMVVGPALVPAHPNLSLWFPNENEVLETGAKRGTGYVISTGALAAIPPLVLDELKLSELRIS